MFQGNIEKLAKENNNFRKVIYTSDWSQLVLMNIPVGEEIGEETHRGIDQILFLVDGKGDAIIDDKVFKFEKHGVVFVPAGTKHNFRNTGNVGLKLYTVYSPPAHTEGTIHATKADAQKAEEVEFRKVEVSAQDMYENI